VMGIFMTAATSFPTMTVPTAPAPVPPNPPAKKKPANDGKKQNTMIFPLRLADYVPRPVA